MKLLEAVEAYVQLRQSLGTVFASDRRILRSFGHHLGDLPVDALTPDACRAFCLGAGAVTRFAERKHQTLRGFFTYLTARGLLAVSPLPEPGPRAVRTFQPHIYTHAELRRLLDATAILASPRWPLRELTFRTLLLTLYGAGLRAGEALRLRNSDVDLDARVLTIWDTKFFKSRLVPIGTARHRADGVSRATLRAGARHGRRDALLSVADRRRAHARVPGADLRPAPNARRNPPPRVRPLATAIA